MSKIQITKKLDCNRFKFSKFNCLTRIFDSTTITTTTTVKAAALTKNSIRSKMQSQKNNIFINFYKPQSTILLTLLAVIGLWAHTVVSSPVQQKQQQYASTSSQLVQKQYKSAASFSSSSSSSSSGAAAIATSSATSTSSIRVQQCREGCLEKFSTKDDLCLQNSECLTCWDECAKPPPPKPSKTIRETWSLHTVSMLQQDSLVLVDVAWEPLSMPTQCLVTWEVSGGGLMGNLLTESFNVQLSLWPETKYRVQVTCKNKLTGTMTRSLPLSIDTAEAIISQNVTEKQTSSSSSQTSLLANLEPTRSETKYDTNSRTPISSSSITQQIDENSLSIDSAAVNSADVEDTASVLPYEDDEDHSSETLHQHTNFVFNWHTKNSGISTVENLQKPDMNLLTIQILSNMQKPLLFGVAAGTLLMTFVLLLYICLMRQQRTLSDKTALMRDAEAHAIDANALPAAVAAAVAGRTEENCQHAANCSRYALKV